jgi:manganese transport protein
VPPIFELPQKATAPFCPSEVKGSITIAEHWPFWRKLLQFAGPGVMVSVGYMDPGNWATDIQAGSKFGFSLLSIVLLSSLAAIILQILCVRLGIVTGKDLAQLSRESFSRPVALGQWVLAEIAIMACDLAEVLGTAIAFQLIFGCSLVTGVLLTILDTVIVLSLQGKGFRRLEAIVLGLVLTVGFCFLAELFLMPPPWTEVLQGLLPRRSFFSQQELWYLAIGIVGATVMPHNLYLHSSTVQTREIQSSTGTKQEAIRLASIDTIVSLSAAFFVNAAILIMSANVFHGAGYDNVADIRDAHHLLEPIVGTSLAGLLFAIALFAAGQSSTLTGTIAGQIVMEGFLKMKIPCWQRRLITRGFAICPALIGAIWFGEGSAAKLLVLSQVVLSFQLPFAMGPLIYFTGSRRWMGNEASGFALKIIGGFLFFAISAANVWLIFKIFAE